MSSSFQPAGNQREGNTPDRKTGKQLPDWRLIDEISVSLLEKGVGAYDVLQRALPSVVFASIDRIVTDDTSPPSSSTASCTADRLLKLFRISQLQLQYILQTQQELVIKLERAEEKLERYEKENKTFRRSLLYNRDREDEGNGHGEGYDARQPLRRLYKCNECSKIFLHDLFLVDHIQRRHGGNLGAGGAVEVSQSEDLKRRRDQRNRGSSSTKDYAESHDTVWR